MLIWLIVYFVVTSLLLFFIISYGRKKQDVTVGDVLLMMFCSYTPFLNFWTA